MDMHITFERVDLFTHIAEAPFGKGNLYTDMDADPPGYG